ncbi:MAG: glycosyltransferase [Fibrobacterota bacterium]|nr:glycosyltransferase [Fibrobacterota bacterium]
MIFLDINTFYSPKAGGIRTYHQAKIEWFRKHPGFEYILVHPGPVRKEHRDGQVTFIEAYGPALTKDPAGYRLLIDFLPVLKLILRVKPEVLETGDAWLTGLFCLFLKKTGLYKGLLVSFYHSDPVPSYFEPWAERGCLQGMKKVLVAAAAPVFYWLQRGYDLTTVSSKTMEERLHSKGVHAVAYLPFGVPAFFQETDPASPPKEWPGVEDIRLLYAGRLDREKGINLLLESLDKILTQANVRLTVVGCGAMAGSFASYKHKRFRFLGFIDDASRMREIYDSHHILVAPGPYETFGLGVLEAMARGLVVVGPDQGGTGELLRQAQSPFIFKTGEAHGFLRALDRAMECDWAKESARSKALALTYGTWDDAIGRMIKRYSARLGARHLVRASP